MPLFVMLSLPLVGVVAGVVPIIVTSEFHHSSAFEFQQNPLKPSGLIGTAIGFGFLYSIHG